MAAKLKYEVIAVNDIEVLADVSLMNILTGYALTATITPPSTHLKVGIRTPRKGHKRPLSNVVFLYPSKTQGLNRLVYSVMVGCIEQPLKRLACSFAGSSNLIHSIAQSFEPFSGGYSLLQRNHHVTR
jgi:hypothetical protein